MSKRNFILFIIIGVIILGIVLGVLYSQRNAAPTTGDTTGTNFLAKFNPFAKGTSQNPTGNASDTTAPDGGQAPDQTPAIKLQKVSGLPVAGYSIYKKERLKDVGMPTPPVETAETAAPSETTSTPAPKTTVKAAVKPVPPPTEFVSAVRYVDRINGNVYQAFADKIEEQKFSSTVIPKIYEAYFGNSALSVIMRYLDPDEKTIETFLGNLPKETLGEDRTEPNEVKGTFLPQNVTDMSVSPDAKKIFYLFNLNETAVGTVLGLTDNKKTQVFDSPFTEWLSFWPKSNMITLTTKPSSGVPGYMYAVDTDKKTVRQVMSGINGLTTLTSPDGKLVLYTDNTNTLYVYHTDTRNSGNVALHGLPEKCVWGHASDAIYCAIPKSIATGNYPDIWYKGATSFNDQIWKIDLVSGNTALVIDPAAIEGGEEVDGIKLALDESEDYLFFINKKDSALWELNLK